MEDQSKIVDKIKKLIALSESEAAIGNDAASITIADKAQELLIKFKLDQSILQKQADPSFVYIPPVVGETFVYNPFVRSNARTIPRMQWFEELAKAVAEGYYCKAATRLREEGMDFMTGKFKRVPETFFVGLDMDREIAIMVFLKLAEQADKLCKIEMKKNRMVVGTINFKTGEENPKVWMGDEIFINSFHKGFREQVRDKYLEHSAEFSSSAAQEYMDKNYPAHVLAPEITIPETSEIAIEVGRKAARFSSKKSGGSISAQAKNELIKQKTDPNFTLFETVMVIDESGSMSGEKILQARDGAVGFAEDAINKGHSVGLIGFDSGIRHRVNPTKELKELAKTISKMDAGTSTAMHTAISAACAYFRNFRARRTIFLVTDGWPDNREDTIAAADNAKRMGIKIITLGCGAADEDFLKQIASDSSLGQLVDSSDLKDSMRRMAGLLST